MVLSTRATPRKANLSRPSQGAINALVWIGTPMAFRITVATHCHLVQTMLRWALIFLVIAIIAAVLGYSGIEVHAANIARATLLFFLILALGAMLAGSGLLKRK
jgi:uncharacterized membrane protein YtjA (UPF0391 family)